jgi:hypothetical protein
MTMIVHFFIYRRSAYRFGARLGRIAISALLAMPQSARGAKSHAAAAAGKISLTHI